MLVKIPARFRPEYIDRAKTVPATQFKALAASVIKQFREAVRQGKLDSFFKDGFQAQPHLRSLREIQDEFQNQTEAPFIIATEECKTPQDGWRAALQWAMHLDRQSVIEQEVAARGRARQKWES
jgi:hypothetical protein